MPYVYILQTGSGKYYVGSTVNIAERMKHHSGGFTPSTRRMGKLSLIFSQEYNTLDEARSIERKLKDLKRKDYLEKIVREGQIKMKP